MSFIFSSELEVEGDLKVTGTIQNDSLAQVILNLQAQITILQNQLGLVPDCHGIPGGDGYVDCDGICDGGNMDCTVTDFNGYTYQTAQIGSQIWMTENLRTTHYRNGVPITSLETLLSNGSTWGGTNGGAYTYSDAEVYGLLYNWHVSENGNGVCPAGWHVPTDEDWKELEITLQMCMGGDDESYYNNGGCVNDRGFRGDFQANLMIDEDFLLLLGGYITHTANLNAVGQEGWFWTSSVGNNFGADYAYARGIYSGRGDVYRMDDIDKKVGMSIRCIQD